METLSLFPLSPPLPSSHVIRHVILTTMQPHNSSSRSMHSPLSSSNSPQTVIINMKKNSRNTNNNYYNNNKRRGVKCLAGVREIKESEFSEVVLRSELPVLVEFVANWCGPCRLIAPAVHSLAQEYKEKLTIVKIDHDLNPSLIEEYKVYGLPTLILFKNGKVVPESRREGAITKVKLKAYVDSLLDSISVA